MVKQVIMFVREHRIDVFLVLVLLVVAAVPRLTDLGLFLTADEKNWIGRSYEFIRAFKDWRFNDMMQTTHPGVTTMWAAGAAITAKMLLAHIPFSFRNLVHFVFVAQFTIALINTLLVPVIYLLLRQVFKGGGTRVWYSYVLSFTASMFIALNPFIIGYSRVAHVDALLAGLLFCAVLTTLLYVQRNYSRRWLVISAVASVLAILTKAPAVFIVPFFVLVVLVQEGRGFFSRAVLKERMRDFLLWLLMIGILFVLLWPAILWVPNPEGNVLLLKRDIGRAAVVPHHMAEDYTVNPAHYPATLLTRLTLPIQFLVFAALGAPFFSWAFRKSSYDGWSIQERRIFWLLLAYALLFVGLMTLGAKKGDRYILPVFPALDVLAAFGLVAVARSVTQWLARFRLTTSGVSLFRDERSFFGVLAVIIFASLVFTVYRYHPYAIAYSNPAFPDNVGQELGWGEGLEQVAGWLNDHAPQAVVASWYPEELGAYTSAHVAHLNAHEQLNVRYIVLYRNMFGRAPDHPANDFIDEYYKKRFPVYIAYVAGKEFAWVYEKPVFEKEGELTFGRSVGQSLFSQRDDVAGIDVMIRKFPGRGRVGELLVTLSNRPGGALLHRWRVPFAAIISDRWLRLTLPERLPKGTQEIFLDLSVVDASVRVPLAVRSTVVHDVRDAPIVVNNAGEVSYAPGDLAVRLLFSINGDLVTEDDDKLLQ